MSTTIVELARQLIRETSVSPEDGNCQQIIGSYLEALGFDVEHMPFGPVSNLWATRRGNGDGPMFVFAGHTDVVPTGPLAEWTHPPFDAVVEGDRLHGRGAADMKGSLAAMMTAVSGFLEANPVYHGTIAFLITSDEEDAAVDGTVRVMDELEGRGILPDYCLVGEPSSSRQPGDVVRVGRRGSLNGKLRIKGIQGHVAYAADARNPIHEAAPILALLTAETWDEGNEFFPATSFQISNIHGGTGAGNVIPGELVIDFNFRYSTESSEDSLRQRTEAILDAHLTDYELDWTLSGPPFLTTGGSLIPAVCKVIKTMAGYEPELSTSGGTSDGRFIAPRGVEVVELGPNNQTIHKINEQVPVSELV
ncbi:MAG: succinyl-diaminopimelate desuccinylase [Proteobacteria bacterium]|nr:succinyl-diaminopimelate desuccinylase [Pseudomonadota bacterium]